MTREDLIARTAHLFWYLDKSKLNSISNNVLVEFIFNWGTLEDIRDLVGVLGRTELRRVYEGLDERQRANYAPEYLNHLRLVSHAS